MGQIPLPQDFKDLLNLLHAHGVRYLLIGGWAVGFHGVPRNTADIDIWFSVDRENCEAIVKTLREFINAAPAADEMMVRPYQLRMGVPPNRVEFITDISGVEFEKCYKNSVRGTLDGAPAVLIGLKDLLTNKRAAGRDKDISDVKLLEKYHKLAKQKRKK